MYKSRFTRWKVGKNLKDGDEVEINRQKNASGQRDVYILPGRGLIPSSRGDRYSQRKAGHRTSQHRARHDRVTTESLSLHDCFKQCSVQPTLFIPSDAEDLLRAIKRYHDGVSSNYIWYEDRQDRLCISKTAGTKGRFRMSLFHDKMMAAISNMDHKSPSKLAMGREIIDGCMAEMGDILSSQDPFLIANMFHILFQIRSCQLPDDGRTQLEGIVVESGRCMSALVLGETHPLTTVWGILERQLELSEGVHFNTELGEENPQGEPEFAENDSCKDATVKNDMKSQLFVQVLQFVLDEFRARLGHNHVGSLVTCLHLHRLQGNAEWKQDLISILAILDGGRAPGRGFFRIISVLRDESISQERIARVTKYICRLLRARLNLHAESGGETEEGGGDLDLEADLVQCLSPAPTIEADYLP